MTSDLIITGAREHNLKNIYLAIPRDRSSSSPASPARASRRSPSTPSTPRASAATSRASPPTRASSWARWTSPMWTHRGPLARPSPSSRRPRSRNPRSTVGTVTEIYDYLRLLYARVGTPHCPNCGRAHRRRRPWSRSSTRSWRCAEARASASSRRSCAAARASTASSSSSMRARRLRARARRRRGARRSTRTSTLDEEEAQHRGRGRPAGDEGRASHAA